MAQNAGNPRAPQSLPIEGMLPVRSLDACEPGLSGGMTLIEVVNVVAFGDAARSVDQVIGNLAEARELLRRNCILNERVAVLVVKPDLVF